jgi:hypothetical protein
MMLNSNPTLAQTLALLGPEAGAALLPVTQRQALIAGVAGLPPLVDALLKFGLAANDGAIALQQRVGQGSAEIGVLECYLTTVGESPVARPVANRIAKLLAAWQQPTSPLIDIISELWLAYDVNGIHTVTSYNTTASLTPSLAFGLPQSLISPHERWLALQIAFDILFAGQWRAWGDALLRTMIACPPEAFVSHIGVRLGQNSSATQVNVKRLRPKTLARYLEMVEWPGDIAFALALAERLDSFADHLTLCLDVGAQVAAPLAFECNLISQAASEPRWAALLDELVGQGLCTPAKRDDFLGWAGMSTPLLTPLDWPDQLVVESLTRPANHLSVLQRRFGQIKILVMPGGALSAKGYLRFMPQWLRL